MKIYKDEHKLIIRDELLKETAKYKLFLTITSENEMNKMKAYFISIEIGDVVKKVHAHMIVDIESLDYGGFHAEKI